MTTESAGSIKPVAVIIVGADMLVAATPATPIQLWHACLASGYDLAVPATWGDELVAAECLRALGSHPEAVAVMCSCPMVARAVGDGEADMSAHLVSLVAPPVAAARYLRRVYGDRRVHITFAGACPSAGDSAIDSWLTPTELLGRFLTTGIELERQPQLFESVLPPDRRRHLSQPGGLPTAERAAALARPRQLIEIDDADVMASIRRHLLGSVRALVDVAPRLGCACSGAVDREATADARRAIERLEPPRSMRPVMPDPGGLGLLRRVPPRSSPRDPRHGEERSAPAAGIETDSHTAERPAATSRPASRSPLSWNLRERALPQPPTTGKTPGASSHRGTAASTWSSLGASGHLDGPGRASPHPTSTTGSAEAVTLDPATIAAARALEARARDRQPAGTERSPVEASGAQSSGTDSLGPAAAEEQAVPDQDDAESASSGSRTTPPGGYWFVAPPATELPDMEIVRRAPDVEPGAAPSPARANEDAIEESGNEADPSAAPQEDAASAPSTGDDVGEPSATDTPDGDGVRSAPDTTEPGDADGKRDPEPPDRGWIVATTIVLLLASALVARGIVDRRVVRPVAVASPFTGRATADVVLVMGPGVGERTTGSIESVFVAPRGPSTDSVARTRLVGR